MKNFKQLWFSNKSYKLWWIAVCGYEIGSNYQRGIRVPDEHYCLYLSLAWFILLVLKIRVELEREK